MVFQVAISYMVQHISERTTPMPPHASTSATIRVNDRAHRPIEGYDDFGFGSKESKVVKPQKNSWKNGWEVYRWFPQFRLVFPDKLRAYFYNEDKVA